jgi:septal ring factor EnvC (AmiA/AmiB activator)
MTRDDVLKEFGAAWNTSGEQAMADEIVRLRELLEQAEHQIDEVASMLYDCENERDGLKDRLAAVEAERDEAWNKYDECVDALAPFGVRFMDPPDGGSVEIEEQLKRMARALVQAEAILSALREPSGAVIRAAQQKWDGDYCHMDDAIRAAVAAAEKEVGDA